MEVCRRLPFYPEGEDEGGDNKGTDQVEDEAGV